MLLHYQAQDSNKGANQRHVAASYEDSKQSTEGGVDDEYEACLDKVFSLGLDEETSSIQDQCIDARAGVSSWLLQVVEGWETRREEVLEKLREARRLGLSSVAEAAEVAMAEREKEIMERSAKFH